MTCEQVDTYKKRLDAVFKQVDDVKAVSDDPEILAHWAKYLCVLVAGFVEVALREILNQYVTDKAEPRIVRLVWGKLKRVYHPNRDRILEVTGWFDPEWANQLKILIDDEHESAIDSIMDHRNIIAHGGISDITLGWIEDWYKCAVTVVEILEMQCKS